MTIYVLRHAVAVDRGTPGYADDSQRPLTKKGKRKLRQITAGMKVLELSFDLILASPFLRARQTAAIVARAFNARKRLELTTALVPGHEPQEMVGFLIRMKSKPENVLIVGHEPDLSNLISLLVAQGHSLTLTLKKGGLAKLHVKALRPGCHATLEWLLTPRQMIRMVP